MLIRYWENYPRKGYFFVILRCSIVFFPDKMVDRDQAPVLQTLDSAIHRISITEINYAIRWVVIYPVDSAIRRLNNRGQYVFVRWKLPCQCIYGFLLSICLLWFNFILGLDFITIF